MPEISFNCPICQQLLEAPEEMTGQVIECPACQKEITIPAAVAPEPVAESVPEPEPEPQQEAVNKCPGCGAVLEDGVVLCLQCGYHMKLGKKIATDFK